MKTYSGKLVENITQAVARDVLREGILNAEAAGYPVVVRVHDELICEVPDEPQYTAERLAELMCDVDWADGLPLAAAGFSAMRYRKE